MSRSVAQQQTLAFLPQPGSGRRNLSDLRPGDHVCCIVRSPQEHRQLVTSFVGSGLKHHQKVVYIYDSNPADVIQAYLREDGMDPGSYLRTGQLCLIPASEAYTRNPVFSPEDMFVYWKAEMGRAQAEGYVVMRVTGEMTWAENGHPGSDRLMEYEARINEFLPGSPLIALCQYDLHKSSPSVLLDVLLTHPMTALGGEIFDNFYYMPPAEFLSSHAEEAQVHLCLQEVEKRKRVEEALQRALQQLQAIRSQKNE